MTCGCGCGACAGPLGSLPPALRFLTGAAPPVRVYRIGSRLYIGQDDTCGSDSSSGDMSTDTSSSSSSDDLVSNPDDSIGNLQLGQGVTPNSIQNSITSGAGQVTGDASDLSQQLQGGNYSGLVQNGVLDAQKLAGAAVNTYSKAQTVAATLNSAASTQPDFSGQKTQQAQLELAAAFTAVATVIGGAWGAAMGAAFTALLKAVGAAHAGYGYCVTSPPPGSSWPQLKAWVHYTSFDSWAFGPGNGTYPTNYAANSFEAWANPILQYNLELGLNCFGGGTADNGQKIPSLEKPAPVLLAMLVQTWNQLHTGPLRAIKRYPYDANLTPAQGWLWDPIAASIPFSCEDASCPVTLQVNNGPPVKQIKLHLAPLAKPINAQQMVAALSGGAVKTGATTASTVAGVAGVGAVAAGAYLVHTAGGIGPALAMLRRLVR